MGNSGEKEWKIVSALYTKLRDFVVKFLNNKSHRSRSELSQPFVVKLEEVHLKRKVFRITGA